MARSIREPIQVYLTAEERERLDRAAAELGVSRSEALRRGILALGGGRYDGLLRDLADEGYVTPARVGHGGAPASAPVATLDALMAELDSDRRDR